MTPWTVAHKVPLSMEFSGQEQLEWVTISFSRRSSRPRDQNHVSRIGSEFFITETPGNLRGLKIKDLAGLVSPGGSRGNSIPCLLRLLETASIH